MDSQYKRMVVLPETEYVQLKQFSLKANRSELPIWPEEERSNEREQKLYALSLAKRRDAVDSTDPIDDKPKETDFSHAITLFPVSFRARAKRLLSILEKNKPSEIQWDDTGEATLSRHGSPIVGSNIVDLIHHATALKQRQDIMPKGWAQFKEVLKRINVPLAFLNKETGAKVKHEEKVEEEEGSVNHTRKKVIAEPLKHSAWIRV
jgi:hypothetical protein